MTAVAQTTQFIAVMNLATGEEETYLAKDLSVLENNGIDPRASALLFSYLRHTNQATELATHMFDERTLIMKHWHKFVLGKHTLGLGDWATRL